MRSRSILDWLPGLAFAALYLATPSRNLDLTHDSVFYLLRISLGIPQLDPNHLVFEPMMAAVHRLLGSVVPGIGLERAIQIVDALSGAAALQAGWMIAVHRLGIGRPAAWLATAAAGFTYGVWYYSVTVETYIVPLALLAWSFYLLTSPRAGTRHAIAGAIGHSLATLVHQSAVLFGPAALAALLTMPGTRAVRPDFRSGLRRAGLYLAICIVLVGGAYTAVAVYVVETSSLARAIDWARGHGTNAHFWSAPPRAFLEAAVGFGRAIFGGYYAFAVDALRARIEQALPGSYLGDELFLVRSLPQAQAIALVGVTALVGMLMAGLAVVAIGRVVRRTYRTNTRGLVLLLVWFVAYVGFFTFWDPKNADFWIVPAFLVWYVLAGAIVRPDGLPRGAGLALAAAAAGLLVTTGAGIIRLTSDPANDFYTVHLREVPAIVKSSDMLVVGDDWPIARHIGYRLKHRAVYLTIEREVGYTPADVAGRMVEALRSGHRLFVTDDVLDVKGPSIAVRGEDYARFVRDVASRLCDLRALPAGPYQLQLYEVGCVRTEETTLPPATGEAASGTVQ